MTVKYVVRLIYPAAASVGLVEDPQALLKSIESPSASMTVFGSLGITEVFMTVNAGSPFRALTEASVQALPVQEALGCLPDSADVISPREYRRRLRETNLPILADALRELDEMDVMGT